MGSVYDESGVIINSQGSGSCHSGTSEEAEAESNFQTRVQHLTGLDALPIDGFLQIVGMRVRAQRSVLRMSRKRLSEVSGVSERYLAQLESGQGNISIVLLRKVTASIGVTLGALLSSEIPEKTDGNLNSLYGDTANQSSLGGSASYPATGCSVSQSSTTSGGTAPQRARLLAAET